MAILETRTFHRVLAALPDAVAAAYLIQAWWLPVAAGRAGVFTSVALMALELPALFALASLFMLHSAAGPIDRIKSAIGLSVSVGAVVFWTAGCYATIPSIGLVVAAASMLWGKWLIFVSTKRDSTWLFEGMKLFAHFLVFALTVNLAVGMEIPRGGFSDPVLQDLQLPAGPFGNSTNHNDPWRHPWWLLAAGVTYFAFCSLSRYFLSAREPENSEISVS